MWEFAQTFGWTPAQVDALDMDDWNYFRAGFDAIRERVRATDE
jgi:hypothetical protein